MAEFLITAPDGKKYKITGATREGALAALKNKLNPQSNNQAPEQPNQPNYNPPGTGLGRALKRGLYRTGQAGNLASANINSNMLASMDVNKVETLDRALKLSMPPETYDRVRKLAWDYLGGVETDEDLNSWLDGLEELGVMPQHIAKVKAMTLAAEAAKTNYRQEGGKFDQIEQRGNRALEKAGEKQKKIDALPMSPTAQTGAQDFQDSEGVLDWAKSSFKNPLGALAFIGEIAAESTPSIAAGLATTLLTGNPVAGAGVMVLSGAPQSYSGEFVEFLREKNIDLTDPEAIKNALQNDDILAEANRRGMTKAAIIAFFEALGMKAGGGILRQTAAQSTTGGAGEGASSYVLDGKIVPKDMVLEAVAETATVPGEVAIMKGRSMFTSDGNLVDPNSLNADENKTAASVAKMLRQIANQNGYNLGDVNASSSKGAKQTLEATHESISEQIKQIAGNKVIKDLLSPKKAATLDQLIEDYTAAQVAIRQGKNKVKSKVTKENYDAIMRLLPDSAEKTQIANLLKMSNQVTDLFNNGLKGGISQYTDYFNPLATSGGAYDPSRLANIILGAGGAFQSGGSTLGIAAGGRVVDAVTGRRSAINRFTQQNERRPGLDAPSGNSLIQAQTDAEAAAQQRADQEALLKDQRKAERKETNRKLAQVDAPPTKDSPQDTLEVATGLNRDNVARILRIIKARTDTPPTVIKAIEGYEKSVGEGGKTPDLSPLIRAVRQFQRDNSSYSPLDFRPGDQDRLPLIDGQAPNRVNVDTTNPTQPRADAEFGNQRTTPENYNRGIEDNKALRQSLEDRVLKNPDIKGDEELRLLTSLSYLRDNLGTSPVPRALQEIQDLEDSGVVSQENIDTYVRPYVDRIVKQQRGKAPEQPTVQTDEEIQAEAEQFGETLKSLFKEGRVDEQKSIPDLPPIQSDPKKPQAPLLDPQLIPEQTRTVYKLMKVQKKRPGEILPLYAKSGGDKGPPSGYSLGKWYASEFQRPKIGNKLLSPRSGIHGVELPVFDQGKAQVSGEQRVWVEVEMPMINPETQTESDNSFNPKRKANDGILNRNLDPTESYDFKTNPNASQDARGWPIAGSMRPIRILNDAEVSQILRDNGLENQVDNSFTGVDATKAQELMQTETATGPVLSQTPNPLNIDTNDLAATNLNEMPSAEDIAQMREGDYKPENKRTLVEAVDYLNNKWQQATGRKEPFEYTPENVDRIASLMATEAMQALKNDGNAIGWYDRKLKAAKSVVSLVEPRVTQSPDAEAAFDFALAVTSNGQAVANNFEYALEVFRHFMDNGVMPTDTWIKGGERNKAMIEAFDFFNTYNASGQNMAVQDFLDSDFTVKELDEYIANFNSQYGTKVKVPSSEGKGTDVKGSYIIGPKIGQGFYQNIRGNYDPLTMDIWWMRMWNRLVGRPFEASKDLGKNRATIREQVKPKNQDALEKRLTNQTLKELGIKRSDLKNDETLDTFVTKLERNYQSFFRRRSKELKGTKQKVEKPQLFKSSGTMTKNMVPQLQAQPKGPGERSYMRTVTKAAIEKLRQNGYMIDTADFQALMWYPEKQLFRKLGVAPGSGADNDYLDAAKMLALKEGFTDDQINQTLPPSDGDGAVSVQPGAEGQTSGVSPGTSRVSQAEESRQIPALQSGDVRRQSPRASTTSPVFPKPSLKAVKDAILKLRPAFQIGKKGSKYENGIQSIDEALELAKALGVTVEMFGTAKEMQAATVLGQLPITNEGTVGAYFGGTIFNRQTFQTRTVERTSTAGTVFALASGAESSNGTRTDLDVLTTILHELAHALTLSKIDPNVSLFDGSIDDQYDNSLMQSNPDFYNDFSPPGSFVNSAIKPLVMAADGGKPNNAVLQEIDNLQENIEVYTTNNPQERTALRDLKRARKKLEEAKSMGMSQGSIDVYGENIDNYKSYTQNSRELAVDPVLLYLLNPKLAKKLAPKTTALIRGEFEKAKDSKVQFFSHPFAVVAAVVMAMMAAKDEEEERRRMMPPPGALNQPMQPGALSA